MDKRIKHLFSELNTYWNMSGPEYKGENPACFDIQSEILNELQSMTSDDVVSVLNELSDTQLDQIISIVEEIISEFPKTSETFVKINADRDIPWLNDELKLLGIIEE